MIFRYYYSRISRAFLLILLYNIINPDLLLSQHQETNLISNESILEMEYDVIKNRMEKVHRNARNNQDTVKLIKSLITLSSIERVNLNYSSAFNYSGEALFLAEEINDIYFQAKAHEELGLLNNTFDQYDLTKEHFRKSCNYYLKAYQNKIITSSELIRPYYNLALTNQRLRNIEITKCYLDTCFYIADSIDLPLPNRIILLERKATLLYHQKKPSEALDLLLNCEQQLLKADVNTQQDILYIYSKIYVYTTLGNVNQGIGNYQISLPYYRNAIKLYDSINKETSHKSQLYTQFSLSLIRTGRSSNAYNYIKKSKLIDNKLFSAKNTNNKGFLTIRNRYNEELRKRDTELVQKNLLLAEQKKEILGFRIILYSSIFLLIIIGLILRSRMMNKKHQREKLDNEEKQKESAALLETKNKELTSTMLQLIEKEEVIKKLSSYLKENLDNKTTNSFLTSINHQSVSLWEEFNTRFMSVNEGFYERLKEKVPGLSPADLKICALIKLNFTSKEMSHLLGISVGSIRMGRHRLRAKINMEKDMNLNSFIHSI